MAALSEDCLYKGAHILEESTASIFGVKLEAACFTSMLVPVYIPHSITNQKMVKVVSSCLCLKTQLHGAGCNSTVW